MSAFADLADAATRSSVGHLFRQLLLATPKTRGLTMTLTRAGDLKFSSYPVQQPSRRAAMQQQSPVSALLFYAAEHRARIKMEAPHLEEMEGVRAEFEALDAEGLAKYEALVQQDVERFRRECEERGIDPDELMSRPARRPDELRR